MKVARATRPSCAQRSPSPAATGRRSGSCRRWATCTRATSRCSRAARDECDVVVMSLFVNPAQFRPGEDLDRYPRDEARDLRLAEEAGADLVYAPAVRATSTPTASRTSVRVERPDRGALTATRPRRGPEHFHGVTTVVAKLFNTVRPDVAYFGQKDAQQAAVIRRMAARPRLPGPDRGAADRARARRAGDELPQRLPRRRRARARRRALAGAATAASERPARDSLQAAHRGRPRASWPRPGSSRSTWRRATPRPGAGGGA